MRTATCTACGKSIFFVDATGVWLHNDNSIDHDGEAPASMGDVTIQVTFAPETFDRAAAQAEVRGYGSVEEYLLALIDIDNDAGCEDDE